MRRGCPLADNMTWLSQQGHTFVGDLIQRSFLAKELTEGAVTLKNFTRYHAQIEIASCPKLPINCKPISFNNILASCEMNRRKLDLRRIALGCRNTEFSPKKFPAVIMRINEPKSTAMIFNSEKFVITGAKSEVSALLAAKVFSRAYRKCFFPLMQTLKEKELLAHLKPLDYGQII